MIFDLKLWLLLWVYKYYYGFRNISNKCLIAQTKHETGNYTSDVFKQNKNLFGMRQAFKRPRTVEGTNLNHAMYKSHRQSIVDYFLRQKYYSVSNVNDTEFMQTTIQSAYAEDTKYIEKWANHMKQVKKPLIVNVVVYGGLFFIVSAIINVFIQKI